jgi:hypothetical protein
VSITMYLTPPTGWKKPITSMIVGSDAGRGKAWASVARYDDAYVKELEGKGGGGVTWGGVAGEGHYDSHKMFKSCGKMIATDVPEASQEEVSDPPRTWLSTGTGRPSSSAQERSSRPRSGARNEDQVSLRIIAPRMGLVYSGIPFARTNSSDKQDPHTAIPPIANRFPSRSRPSSSRDCHQARGNVGARRRVACAIVVGTGGEAGRS